MANVNVRANLNLRGSLTFPQAVDFPVAPKLGETCFKGGVLFIYADIGGMSTWYPTNRPQSSYAHSQGLPALTWVIKHKLDTTDVIVAVYDEAGRAVYSSVTVTDSQTVTIELTEATAGIAVVFGREQISTPIIYAEEIDAQRLTVNEKPVAIEEDLATALDGMAAEFEPYGSGEVA